MSAQAALPRLTKTPGEARRQERKNASLQARSKQRFGESVRRMRPNRPPRGGGS
jgi:hypothetical protein